MRNKIQLTPSGIPLVDEAWSGFYRGGTYLLIGPHKSGKTLISLQFAKESVTKKEICLYFTSARPKDLMINAAAINFDLQNCMDQNQVIVIRINLPSGKDPETNPDEKIRKYLEDIVSVVEQYQPSKIVFDELTPFVGYKEIENLKEVFIQTCEAIEDFGITSLFVLREPVSPASKNIINTLSEICTGTIRLEKNENSEDIFSGGIITITPNIGHTEGGFKADYFIEPQTGVVAAFNNQNKNYIKPLPKKINNYKSLSEIETSADKFVITNFYNENEFHLILNNQIAYYKSTGEAFTLCSFLLNETAIGKGLLTLNQFKSAVRLSADRKDKICIIDKRIIVLVLSSEQKNINNLIARIKSNLPDSETETPNLAQYISVYTILINKSINDADDLLNKIFADKTQDTK